MKGVVSWLVGTWGLSCNAQVDYYDDAVDATRDEAEIHYIQIIGCD